MQVCHRPATLRGAAEKDGFFPIVPRYGKMYRKTKVCQQINNPNATVCSGNIWGSSFGAYSKKNSYTSKCVDYSFHGCFVSVNKDKHIAKPNVIILFYHEQLHTKGVYSLTHICLSGTQEECIVSFRQNMAT